MYTSRSFSIKDQRKPEITPPEPKEVPSNPEIPEWQPDPSTLPKEPNTEPPQEAPTILPEEKPDEI